jgi:hypothetical protein
MPFWPGFYVCTMCAFWVNCRPEATAFESTSTKLILSPAARGSEFLNLFFNYLYQIFITGIT